VKAQRYRYAQVTRFTWQGAKRIGFLLRSQTQRAECYDLSTGDWVRFAYQT